jgi:hypothetical protein
VSEIPPDEEMMPRIFSFLDQMLPNGVVGWCAGVCPSHDRRE